MRLPHQHSRINLDALKAQLMKKLGTEGSKQYFYYLHEFLSLKFSMPEFNKLCLRILGRENIQLHNHFIRSMLRNACSAKAPPPTTNHHKGNNDVSKRVMHRKEISISSDGYQKNGSHSHISMTRANYHHHQVLVHQAESENVGTSTVYSKGQAEPVTRNDEKMDASIAMRSLIQAPLGVPFCSASIGGARGAVSGVHKLVSLFCDGVLVESCVLRERMENIASGKGMEGVSVDCANVLNHGLDSYLKGLIKSCIDIVGVRSGLELTNESSPSEDQAHIKITDGVNHQLKNREQKIGKISLQEFRVAMELNPRQLGEDWPLLLEKMCTHAFEE